MWIKICGQTSLAGVQAAVAHGADALGFIFVDGVRRQRSPAEVAAWTVGVPGHVLKVGVFMDQPLPQILAAAQAAGLAAIQLHGSESPDLVAALQAAGYPVIKVIKLAAAADLGQLATYAGADALLLEPQVVGHKGGAGVALDLTLAAQAVAQASRLPPVGRSTLPRVILAGGLAPETVAAAVQGTAAVAVDVSSGVETDGAKDPARIAAFIQAARGARKE